ncbi:MAG: type II secretion system F family protein [Candidatus Micrarchaeota archaeon]
MALRFSKVYQQIAGFFPQWLHDRLALVLVQGGFEIAPRVFLGFAVFFSLSVALIAFFLAPFFFPDRPLVQLAAGAVGLFGTVGLLWLALLLAADRRAIAVEDVLPDALKIISANIRAGMTLENAFWGAARPEFGAFKEEIRKVSAETFGGRPISESLTRMSRRVRSSVVERAVKLINEGIRLGGEMARLLDEVAADIVGTKLLRKEIATSTLTYSIFIVFAAVVAAPVLFALSTYYAEMNENVIQKQAIRGAGGAVQQQYVQQAGVAGLPGLTFAGPTPGAIKASDIYWFSIAAVAVTTFFAGLTLALIREGKAIRGIKYSPAFIIVALSIYLLAHAFLTATFKTVLR